ncbi:hypothetical protein VNG_0030H [Halobacterium salinarum NRC-1]|uniref:Uncharacterized protein n=2 Tax=Halobacterium salinarum NRC-34001 TaxID=2886895 RepID=Q9HSY0_HALSA|nr:hypothetical protein VNG_0030H [Halobacterium salinarum NRC-1]CAP12910.1 uncharacterized protein OE_1052F [Halobacterium salinarum R1]DAC77357.1 TPA_inf: uncharacterized protein VNG_0030H [Halobacterium salinarum NRC-1]
MSKNQPQSTKSTVVADINQLVITRAGSHPTITFHRSLDEEPANAVTLEILGGSEPATQAVYAPKRDGGPVIAARNERHDALTAQDSVTSQRRTEKYTRGGKPSQLFRLPVCTNRPVDTGHPFLTENRHKDR